MMRHVGMALITIAFGIFVLSLSLFPIEDADIWHHMAYGRWIVEHGYKPDRVSPFVYTNEVKETNFEWVTQVGLYHLYQLWGAHGIVVTKSIFIAAYFSLLLIMAVRMGVSPLISAAVLLVGVLASAERFIERPEHVGYLFLVVELGILWMSGKREAGSGKSKIFIYMLPLLFLFWINMHGSFVVGLGLLWVWVFLGVRRLWNLGDLGNLRHLKKVSIIAGVPVVCTLLILLHPNGMEAVWAAVKTLPGFSGDTQYILSRVYEFQSPFLPVYQGAPALSAGLASLSVAPFVFAFKVLLFVYWGLFLVGVWREKASWFGFFCLLGGTYLACTSVRHINVLVILGYIAALEGLRNIKYQRSNIKNTYQISNIFSYLVVFLLVCSAYYVYSRGYQLGTTRRSYGTGVKAIVADGVVKFLDGQKISGKLLNQYEVGAYLSWGRPGEKVFIDGFGEYPEAFFREYFAMAESEAKAQEILDKYAIDYVVTMYPENQSGKSVPDYLSQSSQWRLVYWDDYYLVFLRRSEKNNPTIERYGYEYGDPLKLSRMSFVNRLSGTDGPLLRQKVVQDLEKAIAQNSTNAKAHLLLGSMREGMGDVEGALSFYKQSKLLNPDAPMAYMLAGSVYMRQQAYNNAKKEALELLARNDRVPGAYMLLGQLAMQDTQYKEAEGYFLKALRVGGEFAQAHMVLGLLYAQPLYDKPKAQGHLERALAIGLGGQEAEVARGALGRL